MGEELLCSSAPYASCLSVLCPRRDHSPPIPVQRPERDRKWLEGSGGYRVYGVSGIVLLAWFRVWGLGLGVWGLGFRV